MVKYASHKSKNVGSNPTRFNVIHYNFFNFECCFDLCIKYFKIKSK